MKKYCVVVFIISIFLSHAYALPPLIESYTVKKNRLDVRVSSLLKGKYLVDDFCIEYAEGINLELLDEATVLLPCVLNVLSVVWVSGKNFSINQMDEDLFHSLKIIKEVFRIMYKNTKFDGELVPNKLVKHSYLGEQGHDKTNRIAQFFTSGLDSTHTSLRHADRKQLLIKIFYATNTQRYIDQTKNLINSFASSYGHETTFVRSNYQHIFNKDYLYNFSPDIVHWRLETVEGLGWVGIAVPLMVLKGITELNIAGSLSWDALYHHAPIPHVDENIQYGGLQFYHDGFLDSRVDKCAAVADYLTKHPDKKSVIRVCIQQRKARNCSRCEKCLRTVGALSALGLDHQKFGFMYSESELVERAKELYPTISLRHHCIYHYDSIQKAVRERVRRNEKVGVLAQWMGTFEFHRILKDKGLPPAVMNWDELDDLLPATRLTERLKLKKGKTS